MSYPLRAGRTLGLVSCIILAGVQSLQDAVANGDTRTISLSHTHRDDQITVTFKRNGRYDEDALKKLNYFLRDWRTDETTKMDPHLFDILWEVHREVGGKEPIRIISSYRSPNTNAMLRRRGRGVARFSQHTLGKAIDFYIPGAPLEQIRAAGLRLQRGGVGFYPSSGSPFVHVDTGGVRHWPRMTREQLVRVFPNGRTVHLPSDGQPLSGYTHALADLERRGGTPGPTRVAENTPKRNFLSRLFGFNKPEEEDEEVTQTQPAPTPARTAEQPKPAKVAAVPTPAPRPAKANTFGLASATQRTVTLPAPAPAPTQTAAQVIDQRGVWRGAPEPEKPAQQLPAPQVAQLPAQPAPQAPAGAIAQRFVWLTGPEGQPAPAERTPSQPPRPPQPIPSSPVETTATISPDWPDRARTDRVHPEVALAYAATATPDAAPQAMPMGQRLPPATTQIARTPATPPKPGQRYNDPWLRGITLAPSVHFSMRVVFFGRPDPAHIRVLMQKPAASLMLAFSEDPHQGMMSVRFTGPAVAFPQTVIFGERHAALR